MTIGNISPQAMATAVWTQTTRELTGLGALLVNNNGFANAVSLAASTSVTFIPVVTVIRMMSIALKAGAAGPAYIAMSDGVTDIGATIVLAGGNGWSFNHYGHVPYPKITNNDGANAATYSYFFTDWNMA